MAKMSLICVECRRKKPFKKKDRVLFGDMFRRHAINGFLAVGRCRACRADGNEFHERGNSAVRLENQYRRERARIAYEAGRAAGTVASKVGEAAGGVIGRIGS